MKIKQLLLSLACVTALTSCSDTEQDKNNSHKEYALSALAGITALGIYAAHKKNKEKKDAQNNMADLLPFLCKLPQKSIEALITFITTYESTKEKEAQKNSVPLLITRLRKLPQKNRNAIISFIAQNRHYGTSYLTHEIYQSLTGVSFPQKKNPLLTTENPDKRVFQPYVPEIPFMAITDNKKASKAFYYETILASEMIIPMLENEFQNFVAQVKAPHTKSEKAALKLDEETYNKKKSEEGLAAHHVAMHRNAAYRKYIETQAQYQRGA